MFESKYSAPEQEWKTQLALGGCIARRWMFVLPHARSGHDHDLQPVVAKARGIQPPTPPVWLAGARSELTASACQFPASPITIARNKKDDAWLRTDRASS